MNSRRFFCQLLAIAALSVSGLSARAEGPTTASVGGTVVSINSASLSFVLHPERGADLTILTTASTVFKRTDGSAASFSNLAVGQHVVVQATSTTAAGGVKAAQVLLPVPPPVSIQVTGTVTSVNPTARTFVVHPEHGADVTVTTNTATRYRKSDLAATFADVTVGAVVVVTGTSSGASVLATQVVIQGPRLVTVGGTVTSIDAGSLSFVLQPDHGTAVTVHTDSGTQFQKGDAAAAFGDLVIGALVGVAAVQNGDGSLQARLVKITGQKAVEAAGTVVSIDAGAMSFVIQPEHGANLTVTTTAATQYKKSDNSAAGFTTLVTGAKASVRGLMASDGSLAATGVVITLPPLVQVGGTVVSINPSAASFVFRPEHGSDVTVTTNAATQFQKSDHSAASFTSLQVGGHVVIQGYTGGGVLSARAVLIVVTQATTR